MSSLRRKSKRERERGEPVPVLIVEGECERSYFNLLRSKRFPFRVRLPKPSSSMAKLRSIIDAELLVASRVVVVYDMDVQQDKSVAANWQELRDSYEGQGVEFVLSNPCFEYWFLLHFIEEYGVMSSHQLLQKLKRYAPNYAKSSTGIRAISQAIDGMREEAIKRADRSCSRYEEFEGGSFTQVGGFLRKMEEKV